MGCLNRFTHNTMNIQRIKSVEPLPKYKLLVTFMNDIQKVYDCQDILKLERFQFLKNEAFFKSVTVDKGGYGISWDDDTDLSEYELWNNGVTVEQKKSKKETIA